MEDIITKKSVLITGCSTGGIGHALALEFHHRGLHVFATARNLSKMSSLASLPHMTLLSLDVTSTSSIAAAVKVVYDHTNGKLDYLVNNSGAQYVMPILDADIEKAKQMYDVNVWGVVAVTQAFAPMLVEARGCVVNISSIAGCLYPPWMGLYAGSKSASSTISSTLRLELAPLNVRTLTVVAGSVSTNLHSNAPTHKLPSSSLYTAADKEIAARVANTDVQSHSTPADFAKRLVNDVLGGKSGDVYRGSMSSLLKWATTWLPSSIVDTLTVRGTGLDKVGSSDQS